MSSLDDLDRRIREAKARCGDLKPEQPRGPVADKRIRRGPPDETLEKLISRFAELSFVRELVENSVDAGATRIDVSTDWEEVSPDGPGIARIFVQDDGSGMDREAIDTRLAVLRPLTAWSARDWLPQRLCGCRGFRRMARVLPREG